MRIISRKAACGSRVGSVRGSKTEAMQKI